MVLRHFVDHIDHMTEIPGERKPRVDMSPEKPTATIYAARNPAMPGLIKIGKTAQDADSRLSQLYTTGVPVPFVCVCAISPQLPAAEVEQALHLAFGPARENPAREFFRIKPEQIVAIMRCLGEDITDQFQAAEDSKLSEPDKRARDNAEQRTRRPNLNFREMGIEPGTELRFTDDESVTVEVVDDRRVRMDGEIVSMTEATKRARSSTYSVAPTPYWTVDGESLNEIYEATFPPPDSF